MSYLAYNFGKSTQNSYLFSVNDVSGTNQVRSEHKDLDEYHSYAIP